MEIGELSLCWMQSILIRKMVPRIARRLNASFNRCQRVLISTKSVIQGTWYDLISI